MYYLWKMIKRQLSNIFQEMKDTAKMIWLTYDNIYWYVDEKLKEINNIENYQDNAMVFYRMFDYINQEKFNKNITKEVLYYINNNK